MRSFVAGFLLVLLPLPALAQGAPRSGPWSEITGERQSRSSLNVAGTVIKQVDGYPVQDRHVRLRPGQHVVLVQWIPRKGLRTSDRTLKVDMKPCRRYYINAQFASPGSSLWHPVVDKIEDIPGCRAPVDTLPGRPPAQRG